MRSVINGEVDERREPAAVSYVIETDPRRLRALLDQLEANLEQVDEGTQRKVRLLVGELIALLVRRADSHARVTLAVKVKPHAIRIDAWDDDERLAEPFWRELGETALMSLAESWGPDRRRPFAAWFEVSRLD